jgi:serine protease
MKKLILSAGVTLCLLAATNVSAQNAKKASAMPRQFILSETLKEGVDYAKSRIIFRVKEQYRGNCSSGYINDTKLAQVLNYLNIGALGKIYPTHQPPAEKKNGLGQEFADLSLIYELSFKNTGVSLEKAINMMLSTGLFEYAEPRYQYAHSAFVPNDPSLSSQNYLASIKAYVSSGFGGGWDTSDPAIGPMGQGDTNVVIGIVDSGSDLAHPDLMNQFKHNYADPINGIDDDGDGYIDNFTGWDLAGADYNNVVGDNNPQIMGSNNMHGSHVSGCASAQTNNGVGVAGVGFKCKLLPVKCAADNDTRASGEGYIITGYEGITYAADHGARVINCSWGGTGGGSYGQNIINYASINKNALVVCAAGNNSLDQAFYPAAFNYVLSVAATNATSASKASFSNWNFTVDISSPGNGIYNTVYPSNYTSLSGTSMASPITAGGAALVLSKWPSYTGLQAGQRLITTGDPINPSNPSYQNKLGGGRINIYKALSNPLAPSVVFTNQVITDHNDMAFSQGDTLFISGDFINYLNPTSSACNAVISTYNGTGTNVTALNTNYSIGVLATNNSKNNLPTPFTYKVGAAPLNSTVTFQVKITDGTYTQSYFFDVLLNPDYVNIAINDVATTITSKGKIGWNQDGAAVGLGFTYLGTQILYEAGLMVGTPSSTVSNCVRGTTAGTSDADFANLVVAQKVGPTVSNFDVLTKFNDALATPTQNLVIRQNAYAWTSAGSRKFVICEYIIKNTGAALNNAYAGIFADWDIDATTYNKNKSDYDFTRKMGYSWATPTNGYYAGIKLLTTSANANFYGIDNAGTGRGGINLTSTFSKADKYTTLSTFRQKAGDSTLVSYPGNDVCNVMSSGPFNLNTGDSIKIAFALIAGDNLTQLQTSADTAQIRYNNIGSGSSGISTNSIQNFVVYPNPAADAINFVFGSNQADSYTITLTNVMGQTVKTTQLNASGSGFHTANLDISDLAAGTYIYKVTDKTGNTNMGKVIVKH